MTKMVRLRLRLRRLLLLGSLLLPLVLSQASQDPLLSCSVAPPTEKDPSLVEMKFDIGDGEESFWAYVQPNVTTFYGNGPAPATEPVPMKHKGLAAKFINLSNQRIVVYWAYKEGDFAAGRAQVARVLEPFMSRGSGGFRGHIFFFALEEDPTILVRTHYATAPPHNLMVYDPYLVEGDPEMTQMNLDRALTEEEQVFYRMWRRTLDFSEEYTKVTGRAYLSNFPRRRPVHFMWPAAYFGQEHWVTTRESHFVSMPPPDQLGEIRVHGKARQLQPDQPRLLQEYRNNDSPVLNMTLKVISCAPRALEIQDFLSEVEVQHILDIGTAHELKLSTTGDRTQKQQVHTSRSSLNTWVLREKSVIIDAIHRRAADLVQIDEALFRHRIDGEMPELETTSPIVEQLQLVHYDVNQEYTAHHDFAYPPLTDPHQEARYATLLLYLNEGMVGGQTTFPRWANAETFEQLKIVPKIGKAVLFYNILPDGNMDDLSQHEARKILKGEKWLINFWIWDPFITR